jgi:hypothetical protein
MFTALLRNLFRRGAHHAHDVEALPYYDSELLKGWLTAKAATLRAQGYVDYPALVHVETIAACNAACTFCPYPVLERKGTRMPDALIEKILRDLGEIPRERRFQFSPYKISDPFLEARLFDILADVNRGLPNADISLITNGSALTDRNVDRLLAVCNLHYVSISLNYDNAEDYEKVMRLPFERTLERLVRLHQRVEAGEIGFPVRVTRVGDTRLTDAEFLCWAQRLFPRFRIAIVPRNDWIGEVPLQQSPSAVPDIACHRWFDFSITATGKVAMCCMDGQVRYPKGDVTTHSVLELYNQQHLRALRQQLPSRHAAVEPCRRCTYMSY